MNPELREYLAPTEIIDSDNKAIVDYAMSAIDNTEDNPVTRVVKLYYAVRDPIWYNPYLPFYLPEHYRASNVLRKGQVNAEKKTVYGVCGVPWDICGYPG